MRDKRFEPTRRSTGGGAGYHIQCNAAASRSQSTSRAAFVDPCQHVRSQTESETFVVRGNSSSIFTQGRARYRYTLPLIPAPSDKRPRALGVQTTGRDPARPEV